MAGRKVGVSAAFLAHPGFGAFYMMMSHPLLVQGGIFDPQHTLSENYQLVIITLVIGDRAAVVLSCVYSGSFVLYLAFMMDVLLLMDTVKMGGKKKNFKNAIMI